MKIHLIDGSFFPREKSATLAGDNSGQEMAEITPDEWAAACIEIRNWTQAQPAYANYYEVHQRIELYHRARQEGQSHQEALEGIAMNPAAELPHLIFTTESNE